MCAAILTVAEIDSIDVLEIKKSYPILYASRIVRGASSVFLLAIFRDTDFILDLYARGR